MRDRKPIPKNQSEIVQSTINPYLSQGKPINDNVFSHSANRALQTTRKTDKIKDISVGLEDIDYAIKYYFETVIQPTITQDGNRVNIPVVYGSPERWKSVQQDGYYRDTNGKLVLPLIMYKRDNVEKNRTVGNKIDGNLASLFQVFETRYNQRNQYDKFSVLTNRIPSKQYYVSVVPDYVIVTYSVSIFTNYVEQNNKILESIEYSADSYWGDKNRWQFRTMIDSFATTNILSTGEDKIATTTLTLKTYGYLIPDVVNKTLSDSSLHYSPAQVIFGLETIDGDTVSSNTNIDKVTLNASSPLTTGQSLEATSFIGGGVNVTNNNVYSVNTNDLVYLSTNITKVADTVTTSTATFLNTSFLEPSIDSPLPPTSVNNFIFFVNGVNISVDSISSFGSDGGGNLILIINTNSLGYTLVPTDEVTAVGKFT